MVTIRVATPDDAATLAELGERTFRDAFAAQNRGEDMDLYCDRTYGEAQQRRELEDPEIVTFVAEARGEMIGFAQLRRTLPQAELARLYVDARHHGKGVAQQLTDRIFEAARAAGATSIWLGVWEHNPRGIAFYRKCGFRIRAAQPFVVGTDIQTDFVMVRPLD